MSNRNILFISTEFPPGPGGIGKHAYGFTRALVYKGCNVTVLTSQDFSYNSEIEKFNKLYHDNLKIVRFRRTGIFTPYRRWKIINRYLSEKLPECVVVSGRFSLWMGFLIKLKFGEKILIHAFVHGSELSRKNYIYRYFTIKSLLKIDIIWAVSEFTKNILKENIFRKDVKILPNGIWIGEWQTPEDLNIKINVKGNPSLLTVGRLSHRKGQHRVLNALPEIIKYFPDAHYHMIGIQSGTINLKDIVAAKKLTELVTFHGKLSSNSALGAFYKQSQIFIMLSENQSNGDTEGFGIAILEANLFGKPAIGARGCGIEDAISNGNNGRLVDGNNALEIIDAIRDIIHNYDQYSARAKIWAQKHDWKLLIDRFEY